MRQNLQHHFFYIRLGLKLVSILHIQLLSIETFFFSSNLPKLFDLLNIIDHSDLLEPLEPLNLKKYLT